MGPESEDDVLSLLMRDARVAVGATCLLVCGTGHSPTWRHVTLAGWRPPLPFAHSRSLFCGGSLPLRVLCTGQPSNVNASTMPITNGSMVEVKRELPPWVCTTQLSSSDCRVVSLSHTRVRTQVGRGLNWGRRGALAVWALPLTVHVVVLALV
jgi:hypothetical protein